MTLELRFSRQSIYFRGIIQHSIPYDHEIVTQIELHDVEGIRRSFSQGLDPNSLLGGKPLIQELISEYTRGPRFKECVRVFGDFGLQFEDQALLAILMDDGDAIRKIIGRNSEIVKSRYTLRCAYTPLFEVTLLHVCAEFNHLSCAIELVAAGADVNAKAGLDTFGFGGHTPIFHTVNQNNNLSADMMDYLLSRDADLRTSVDGLIWGRGYDWETFIPAVNPISYAMMGSLPQMHRDERTISRVVSTLMKHAYGIVYTAANVPNKYLS